MAELDISKTTTPSTVTDYSVDTIAPDSPEMKETYFDNPNFTKWFGHYKKIAKIKTAIDAYATWVLGKGWEADDRTTAMLEGVTGWGEDTFNSIMWNALVTKKVNGDSFTEIIRNTETGTLINLKPLNPERMRTVINEKGIVDRYEYTNGEKVQKFQPNQILHLCNNRVVNEGRGVSTIEAVEWNVEAAEEAKRSHRKMIKRNGVVRVIEVDIDKPSKITEFKAQWKDAIDKGDVLILPKDVAEAKDWHGVLDTQGVLAWLNYLDDDFYMSIGVPRVILGGSIETSEGAAKMSQISYEPMYTREVTELEADLWNQLAVKVTWIKQKSIIPEAAEAETKNTSQTGFQPKETAATVERE